MCFVTDFFSGFTVTDLLAVVAIAFTGYQAILTRQHNRLSVKPHLNTWMDGNTDHKYHRLSCELINNGLGPAIIKDFKVYFDNKLIGSNQNIAELEKAMDEKIELCQNVLNKKISLIDSNHSLLSGDSKTLLEVSIPMYIGYDTKECEEYFNKFDIEIKYECAYGTKFTLDSRDSR